MNSSKSALLLLMMSLVGLTAYNLVNFEAKGLSGLLMGLIRWIAFILSLDLIAATIMALR